LVDVKSQRGVTTVSGSWGLNETGTDEIAIARFEILSTDSPLFRHGILLVELPH
jgi:hypothetical protein